MVLKLGSERLNSMALGRALTVAPLEIILSKLLGK